MKFAVRRLSSMQTAHTRAPPTKLMHSAPINAATLEMVARNHCRMDPFEQSPVRLRWCALEKQKFAHIHAETSGLFLKVARNVE